MQVLFNDLFEQSLSDNIATPTSRMIDKQIGEGKQATIAVNEDVWIWFNDCYFRQDTCIIPQKEGFRDYVWMYLCLSGDTYFTFQNQAFHIKTGHSAVLVGGQGDICLRQELKKENRCRIVGVFINRDKFQNITGRKVSEIHHLSNLELSGQLRQVPPAMRNVGEQLLQNDFKGVDSKLFLEAKALEFIAYKLGILDQYRSAEKKQQPVHRSYVEKIYYAAELLEQMMLDPPCIFDLAKSVGLDHTKLIQGFKDFLGCTPFEYLSKIRLRKAAKLIGSGGQNVTEASFSVGYSSLSHFAKIFRIEFGVNPKEYSKRYKRRSGLTF